LELHRTQFSLFQNYIYNVCPNLQKQENNCFILGKLGNPISVDGIHAMIEPLKKLFPNRTLSPMTIRQSVICHWLNDRKIPLEDVQDLAGHRFPSATERYKRIDVQSKRNWINKYHPME
jgi:integrase/recombinase XerD